MSSSLHAQSSTSSDKDKGEKKESTSSTETKPTPPAYASILKDRQKSGLWTVYQKGQNLYWEIGSGDYSAEYIVLISISRGIGQGPILGGMSWGFGDDWVWQFRKVDDNVHVVRKNVRFKANAELARIEGGRRGLHRQRAVQPADRDQRSQGGRPGRSDAGLHERPAADRPGAAGLQLLAATNRAGPR